MPVDKNVFAIVASGTTVQKRWQYHGTFFVGVQFFFFWNYICYIDLNLSLCDYKTWY